MSSIGAMTRTRLTILAAGVALAALLVAGCGGGGGGAATASPPKTATGQAATLGAASTGLGKVLVDSQGRTLYLFKKDSGTKSACSGACATAWPPLRANGKPTVGSGATASLVGTTPRSDGKAQITYNGHPLYRYQGDRKAGDTNGQGLSAFGGGWFALDSAGNENSTTPSGGGGSGY
jgi:predicted lipoprotein with Yx(FWY)xxD motif